jgi:hypothetical protein
MSRFLIANRCVDDYRFYNTFPFSYFMPSQLKFRGEQIKVTHAPEPDEIVWENLEVTSPLPGSLLSSLTLTRLPLSAITDPQLLQILSPYLQRVRCLLVDVGW